MSIQRSFLCGGNEDNKKLLAWVKWKDICKSEKDGVLGLKALRVLMRLSWGKWRWNIFHAEKGVWCDVLISKYVGWRVYGAGI